MEVFTAKEVSALLKLGINQTYKLMKSEGFPSYHIGNNTSDILLFQYHK